MRTKSLLFAALVASGVAAAAAAQPVVHAPAPNAHHAPAMLRVDHVPPPRSAYPSSRRDPYAVRGAQSPYQAAIDKNGWFLGWEDRNGHPLPSRGRYAPPRPPSPYHRPVVDQNGWFLHWEDMSGDVSTHPLHSGGSRKFSDGD